MSEGIKENLCLLVLVSGCLRQAPEGSEVSSVGHDGFCLF